MISAKAAILEESPVEPPAMYSIHVTVNSLHLGLWTGVQCREALYLFEFYRLFSGFQRPSHPARIQLKYNYHE
jgi:hypothetical protein